MRCPACETSAPAGAEACPEGHPLRDPAGVFVLLDPERQAEVAALEQAVAQWRAAQGHAPLPAAALPELPDGPHVAGELEWRLRRHDLDLVTDLLRSRSGLRILDVGAWNGWLSHRLSTMGHQVTATEVFAGHIALGAPWPMAVEWRRVQIEPTELDRLEETFDVVILDRCLQFFPDPADAMSHAMARVADGGSLIATGLMIHRSPAQVAARLAAEARRFRKRFGRDLLLRAARGFLDGGDLARMERAGLATHPYPRLRLANVRARIDRSRPEHRYGTAQR